MQSLKKMKIESEHRGWVIDELENWAETFNNDYKNNEEAMEEELKAYHYIHSLIEKFSNNKCNKEDYENILFHLWQSKYDL